MDKIKVRVVKPVEGKKVGDEFECFPHEYKLQIKHKSIEVIGDADDGPKGNASLNKAQIIEKLTEMKFDYDPKLKKDELLELLEKAESGLIHPDGSDVKTLTDADAAADLAGEPRPDAGNE